MLLSLWPVLLCSGCVAEDGIVLVCNPHSDQHGHAEQTTVSQHLTHHNHKACGGAGGGAGGRAGDRAVGGEGRRGKQRDGKESGGLMS